MKNQNDKKPNVWITLIGFILLLVGIYGSVRTAVNIVALPKYPSISVFTLGFMGGFYGPREEDCVSMPFYGIDTINSGKSLTDEEKKNMKEQEKKQQESCISAAVQTRYQTKVNDISQSVLFLFLGGGVLLVRRYLFT